MIMIHLKKGSRMKIKKTTEYIAEDHSTWNSKEECLGYEKLCRLAKLINDRQDLEVYFKVDKISASPLLAFAQHIMPLFEQFIKDEGLK